MHLYVSYYISTLDIYYISIYFDTYYCFFVSTVFLILPSTFFIIIRLRIPFEWVILTGRDRI